MTENAFTQAEAALVSRLTTIAEVHSDEKPRYVELLIKTTAEREVKKYAQRCDQEAAAQAVMQLVKEKLNAN